MSEEFIDILKKSTERNIEGKLQVFMSVLDKLIRYNNLRFEQLESKIDLYKIKREIHEKKTDTTKEVISNKANTPLNVIRDNRGLINKELKELFESKKK